MFNEDNVQRLIESVPEILKRQDPQTGRFGSGIWMVNDQHPIFPLAAAWATKSGHNPFYHDPKVLEAVVIGGDALIEDQDPSGQWEFRKKDGSTWGQIYMPWTYSRWVRAYGLVKEGMTSEQCKRWEDALVLGYTGISKTALDHVHNIPCHHAMGLYIAGKTLDRPEWCEQAKAFMARVVESQDPGGFWSENHGPVVMYNNVYIDALGVYYAVSKNDVVLPALERAALFHSNFTYPNGAIVETVDERNPYHSNIAIGNVGFSFTPEGRGYLLRQRSLASRSGIKIDPDNLAGFVLYGKEGPALPTAAEEDDRTFVLNEDEALVRRKGPWFICLSAYHCPVPKSRWIQDRQNLISVFHDKCGLIIGGGNTKLQPLWSNFTVGDVDLLKHKPGDTNPDFLPKGPLSHIPSKVVLKKTDPPGLQMTYGGEDCSVEVEPVDDDHLRIRLKSSVKSDQPVAAHITLLPDMDKHLTTSRALKKKLGDESFTLTAADAGEWIAHSGWRLSLPEGATVDWPVLPHNCYRKDGSAQADEGRIVVSLPFSKEKQEYELTLSVEEQDLGLKD